MRVIRTLLLTLLCRLPTILVAQAPEQSSSPWTHRSWSMDDGLPQNTATALAQTADGYLWIGTYKGLARYDGYRFERFETADHPGLAGDRITRLLGDRSGNLWIGTEWSGLSRYHNGRFESLAVNKDVDHNEAAAAGKVNGQFIRMLFEDSNGVVWIGIRGGLYRFDGRSFSFIAIAGDDDVAPIAMANDRSGRLWLGTNRGLAEVRDGVLKWIKTGPSKDSHLSGPVEPGRGGELWLLNRAGLVRFVDGVAETVPIAVGGPRALATGRDGTLWLAVSEGGLKYYDGSTVSDAGIPRQLKAGFLRDILVTEEGIVWIAGGDQGLHRLQPSLFDAHIPNVDEDGFSINRVAEAADGAIWAASLTAGLFRIGDGRMTRISRADGLPADNASLLASDAEGRLWFTSGATLMRASGPELASVQPRHDGQVLRVVALAERFRGGVWLATPGAIYYSDSNGLSAPIPTPEIGAEVAFEMIDRSGTLWFAPRAGLLCRLDETTPTCFDGQTGIPQKNIRDVLENRDGSVWFGVYGSGLCELRTGQIKCLSEDHGLSDNTAHKIIEDDFGYVWISSNNGVSRIQRSHIERFFAGEIDRVRPDHYATADGMPSAECNIGGLKARDGRLWYPTMRGVVSVDPADAFTYSVGATRTYLEYVEADGFEAHSEEGLVRVPAGSDRIEFHYTGINFAAPDRVRFRIRLAGHDDDWIHVGSARSTTYTNLPPGTYRFDVSSAVGSGEWSEPATAGLEIAPFPHQTWWFKLLLILGVAALGAGAYRARVSRLLFRERLAKSRAETQRLAELDAAKSRFFANVSHEFRTPLTLIISPTEEALESGLLDEPTRRWGESVLSNARRLLGLIDRLLDLTRLDAGRMELQPSPGDVRIFVEELVQGFAPLAERREINLTFESTIDSRPTQFDHDKLQSILSNLISNALKYTPAGGKVWTSCEETEDEWMEFVIKDTGPGIPKEQMSVLFERYTRGDDARGTTIGSGLGLALTKELIDLCRGVLLVESEPGFGTAFIVRLPLERIDKAPPETGISTASRHPRRVASADDAGMTVKSAENPELPLVLIVEDNPEVRGLLARQLGETFRIVQAEDGVEGLQKAKAASPDVILSDVMLPGIDGMELCRRVKSEPELSETPFVILTARADDEHAVEALRAGADDYIAKPYHAATLRSKLQHLVSVRQLMRRKYSTELVVPGTGRVITSHEQEFAGRITDVVAERLSDSTFSVETLAAEVGLSRRQLTRRVKAAFGESPSDLIMRMRLERAADLLEAKAARVSEIAFKVGFKSASHFGSAFKEAFGHPPSEHLK